MATLVLRNKVTGDEYGWFGTPFPTLDDAINLTWDEFEMSSETELYINGEWTGIYVDDLELVTWESDCKRIRDKTGLSQAKFAERYEIPKRTIENWESGVNEPPGYVIKMLERLVEIDTNE